MPATPAWPPKSTPRLFVEQPLAEGQDVAVSGGAAHYLIGVMRLKVGAPVVLFDDQTGEYLAHVASAGKRDLTLQVAQRLREPEAVPDVWLCQALVKKDRFDWIAEKACELGVARFVPLLTARCVVDKVKEDRLRAHMIEAAEQCERTALPEIAPLAKLDALLRDWAQTESVELPPPGEYAVAMCFLPRDDRARAMVKAQFEHFIRVEGQTLIGWRDVPVDTSVLGAAVLADLPVIRQAIVGRGPNTKDQDAFERKLLTLRKQTQNPLVDQAEKRDIPALADFYMPSFSSRTVVYKGLLLAGQVGTFYLDLQNPLTTSALAMVHQRFSTNTFPSWKLAHPYRFIAHNGEINTVRGNVNWMNARRRTLESPLLGPDLDKMWPLIPHGQSDTACLDNALELLLAGGYSLAHAVMMLIPEAWAGNPLMSAERRAFYEYHAALMEPWDGPAAVAFTDGRQIGATLDRNGLRPARFLVTDDDLVVMASESGVLPIKEDNIVRKWRLQPGRMLLIDFEQGRIIEDEELKTQLAAEQQKELDAMEVPAPSEATAQQLQAVLKARAAIPGAAPAPAPETPTSTAAPRVITTTSAAPAMRPAAPRKPAPRRPAAAKPAATTAAPPAPAPVAAPPPSAEVPF